MRVLVLADEWNVASALGEALRAEQYDVVVERTGNAASFRTNTDSCDLVLLDLAVHGRSGLEILAAIRGRHVRLPVIVLAARNAVVDRISGLDAGADDYLVKPFAFAELLARIRALLRRGAMDWRVQMTAGRLCLDRASRRVTCAGEPVDLTTKEFDLLERLMRCQGQVVSRATLARDVWNASSRTTPLDNVIEVHMARLRRKVEGNGARLLHTIRGVGYMLREGKS